MILCCVPLWVLSIQRNLLDITLKTHAMHYMLLKNGKQRNQYVLVDVMCIVLIVLYENHFILKPSIVELLLFTFLRKGKQSIIGFKQIAQGPMVNKRKCLNLNPVLLRCNLCTFCYFNSVVLKFKGG